MGQKSLGMSVMFCHLVPGPGNPVVTNIKIELTLLVNRTGLPISATVLPTGKSRHVTVLRTCVTGSVTSVGGFPIVGKLVRW